MRLYAKIVSATLMNTTPHATISEFTLVIVVVLAVSTGNTCAMADEAMRPIAATASARDFAVLNIRIHPLSFMNFPQQELHDDAHREPAEEEGAAVAHDHIESRLIHQRP